MLKYIVIIIIGIAIISYIFEIIVNFISYIYAQIVSLYELLSKKFGKVAIVGAIILGIIAYFVYSWIGILIAFSACLGSGLLFKQLVKAGKYVGDTVEKHDREVKAIAQINQETQLSKEVLTNDQMLQNELDNNCRWLGYMNNRKWADKLGNYKDKRYSKSFEEITNNFSIQMEQQNITQNDDWFKPFLDYLIQHPQGATVTKLLNEVSCPQFYCTHNTSDYDILRNRLIQGTKKISKDVPSILNEVPMPNINDYHYVPTRYALKLYGGADDKGSKSHIKEISFEDL